MKATTPKTIDEYIAASSPDARPILRQIRATIRKAVPEAQETISYRMPTFMLNGVVVHFGAFKEHIGLFPPVRGNAALTEAASRYAGEKGNLRFPLAKRMPLGLIARIAKHRAKQNLERAAARKAGRAKRR